MPSQHPVVVTTLRGETAYARYLDRLEKRARRRGFRVANRADLVELALNLLGFQWGILAPRRLAPHGTNRYGEPRPKRRRRAKPKPSVQAVKPVD